MGGQLLLHFSLLLLLSICLQSANAAPFECRAEDKAALLSFRSTLVESPSADQIFCSMNSYDWKESTDCCFWNGIECDPLTGSVVGLTFDGIDLDSGCYIGSRSTFSSNSSLFRITSLRRLSLSYLNLPPAVIPDEIASLSHLQSLTLSHCNFSGLIPDAIGTLANLQELELSGNVFSGGIPLFLSKLVNLQTLDLLGCGFTGTVPAFLFVLPQLSYVDLSLNELEGSLPTTIPVPSNLTALFMNGNKLVGKIPWWIFEIPSLTSLWLDMNRLGPIEAFGKPAASSLQDVRLSLNNMDGPFPYSLLQLEKIEILDLSGNQLAGDVEWRSFNKMKYLIYLSLSDNVGLNIKNTNGVAISLPLLEALNINRCNLTEFPSFLSGSQTLQRLLLSHNQISCKVPSTIGNTINLEVLDLSFNKIGGRIPRSLTNLKKLQFLDLSNNNFEGLIPTANFPNTSYIGNPGLCGPPLSKSC